MSKLGDKLKSFYFKPKAYNLIFIAGLMVVSVLYHYPEVLTLRPQSLHAWRQCDCLSITMNYYKDNLPFLDPAIHCQESDGGTSGHTISEFPVIYFAVAQIWKLTGQQEWIFRLIVLLLVFKGLFFLFKMLEKVFHDSFMAMMVVFLLFSSPMLVYYSNNFIANAAAFGISLTALYYFYQFYHSGKWSDLIMMSVIYLLSGLLKITSEFGFVVILFIFISEWLGILHFKEGKVKVFKKALWQSIPLILVVAGLVSWYLFASNYNSRHGAGYFLIGILPIWEAGKQQLNEIVEAVTVFWYKQYHMPATLMISAIIFIFIIVFNRKIPRLFVTFTLLLFVGVVLYLVLFFRVLAYHDYYLINLLILIVFIFTSGFLWVQKQLPRVFYSPLFRILVLAFVMINIRYAAKNMHFRYHSWPNENHIKYYSAFNDITPWLRSHGIERDDKVISLPDGSWNVSLYLMDQKGWTNYGGIYSGRERIEHYKSLGAKYLVIFNPKVYQEDYILEFTTHKIGSYKNADVFLLDD